MGWIEKMLGAVFSRKSDPQGAKTVTQEFVYVPLRHIEAAIHHFRRSPDDERSLTSKDIASTLLHIGKTIEGTPSQNGNNNDFRDYGGRLVVLGSRMNSMLSPMDNLRVPRAHWDFLQSKGKLILNAADCYAKSAVESRGQVVMPIAPLSTAENLRAFAAKLERLANYVTYDAEPVVFESQRQENAPRQRPF